jgi:glycosyltransferase involved in cell wall biosynthesis
LPLHVRFPTGINAAGVRMRELRIGYGYDEQMARSNVLAAPYCRYVRIADRYRVLAHAGRLLNRCARRELLDVHDLAHQFRELRAPRSLQLLHLFNQVSYGATPWVASFETVLPRLRVLLDGRRGATPSFERAATDPQVAHALAALAGAACRRLIALSQYSAHMQQELLGAAAPVSQRWRELIARKIVVLPPPQRPLVATVAARSSDARLRLLCLGPNLAHDGGLELLETLAALLRERAALVRQWGTPLQLTMVGSLAPDSRGAGHSTAQQQRVLAMIRANRHWIRHYEALDHEAVVRLMRAADVGVLPACAHSGVASVLELQAAGCPVISTNVRALPEVNDDARGWLIAVPRNRLGEALDGSAAQRERLSRALRAGLAHCLGQLLAEPQQVRIKGERALRALESQHDPEHVGARLFDIYMECAAVRPVVSRTSPSVSS